MMKTWSKLLLIAALILGVAGASYAQDKQERAAQGNTATPGASARIDATSQTINQFINTQSARLTETQQRIINLNGTLTTRMGMLTSMLVNFNPVGGCDPEADIHGCRCACTGPDQKLLWTNNNGGQWQCFRAQNVCAPGENFDPETCQCKPCETCQTCEDQGLTTLPMGTSSSCGGTGGECVCPTSGRRPGYGHNPALAPWLASFDLDSKQCPTNTQCKYGLDWVNNLACCCPNGQRWDAQSQSCGALCDAPAVARILGDGTFAGCFIGDDPAPGSATPHATGPACPSN